MKLFYQNLSSAVANISFLLKYTLFLGQGLHTDLDKIRSIEVQKNALANTGADINNMSVIVNNFFILMPTFLYYKVRYNIAQPD